MRSTSGRLEGVPANLSPEYKTAEAEFRRATDPRDRLAALKEMHRTIPKHKGTEHLRADIKTRIKELTEELATAKKAGTRGGPPTVIKPEGAGQIALVGPPNSGKSTLHARLTGSHAETGPYPFATQWPLPGMLPHEDVAVQLIDLPSISKEHPIPWIGNALQPSDGCLFVVDLCEAGCLERILAVRELLAERKVQLVDKWPCDGPDDAGEFDPFTTHLPAITLVNKVDSLGDRDAEIEAFVELTGLEFPIAAASAETGEGLEAIGPLLFERLGVVRVYTKVPGKPADMGRPFTVRRGQSVLDVATLVHKDVAKGFKYARLWGGGSFDGQQVGRDHVVADGDVIEIHT
jgi:ribosome-interacting GTPase 1